MKSYGVCCLQMIIVLVDETKGGLNTKIERWKEALKTKGHKISRTKTEYMECHNSHSRKRDNESVKIDNQEILKSKHFAI